MGKNKKTGENTVKNSVHKKKNSDESIYDFHTSDKSDCQCQTVSHNRPLSGSHDGR